MADMRPRDTPLVYSTDGGRRCPGCGCVPVACVCGKAAAAPARPAADGIVRVSRETQGRGGKGVTVISGLGLAADALEQLARELKSRCGTGGGARDGRIELQGEHRDALVAELTRRGFRVKRAGG